MKTLRKSTDRRDASDRNIKRRTEAPSTGGSSGADDSVFISPEKKSSFERSYRHRKIINGSKFAFHGPEGDRIAGNIEAIGWTPMITMDLPVYPRLVRLFYCNSEYKYDMDETSITSLVNGTPISIDCSSLAAILGIPVEGSGEAPEYFRWCGYDSSRWPTAKYFTEKKRVLHDMLLSTFVPRRHHGRLSGMEKLLMNKILCGERANLCYFILCHMIEFIKCHREDLDLPYGMLLTKVFNAFDVVISPEEEFETMNPGYHCDFFRGGNVQINAGWRSGSLQEVEENDEEGSGDEGQAVEPPAIVRGGNVQINAGWRSGSLQEVEENDEEGSGDEGQAVEPPAIVRGGNVQINAGWRSGSLQEVEENDEEGSGDEGQAVEPPAIVRGGNVRINVGWRSGSLQEVEENDEEGSGDEGQAVEPPAIVRGGNVQINAGWRSGSLQEVEENDEEGSGDEGQAVEPPAIVRGGNVQINAGWRSGSLQEVEENDEEGSGDEGQAVEPPAIETESLSKLNVQVDSVAPSVEDQEEEPGDEEEAGEVAAIKTDTADESVCKLNRQVGSVSPSVEDLQCQPEQGFAILDEPVSKFSAQVDSVDSKFSAQVDSVDSKLNALVDSVASLANLNESLVELTDRVDSLDGKLTARVDSLDGKLTARMDSMDSKLNARVDTVASSVQNLQSQQEKRFADLNSKLDSLIGFLNYHFCPYPPPPTPLGG